MNDDDVEDPEVDAGVEDMDAMSSSSAVIPGWKMDVTPPVGS